MGNAAYIAFSGKPHPIRVNEALNKMSEYHENPAFRNY
jgi:hypothetical protein